MKYVSGDICYILEDNKYATKVKVMGRHGDECIVQRIGACGALRFKDDELFGTEEAALESRDYICKGESAVVYVSGGG